MADRLEISDAEWGVIYPMLAAHKHVRIRCKEHCRSFLVAVLWILRGGHAMAYAPGITRLLELSISNVFPVGAGMAFGMPSMRDVYILLICSLFSSIPRSTAPPLLCSGRCA
jgi:hypothetical protein